MTSDRMNEELTREVLESMKKCKQDCPSCGAIGVCSKYGWREMMQALTTALLEERAKPKYDVWKNAPDWATSAEVFWESQAQGKRRTGPVFTRDLPKTRAREIAENLVHGIYVGATSKDIEYVEGVLTKYAEELKGEA